MQTANRWGVPLVLLLCVILAFFDKVSIAALFNNTAFLTDIGLGALSQPERMVKLGFLMTGFLLAYGFSSTFLSFIGDLISPIKLLIMMMISWGILMLLTGLSNSYEMVFFYRILLGIAEGPLFAIAYTIVKKVFEPKEQARATMLWLLGTPIGASIGFPITLYVLGHYGWRATFYVMAAITIAVVAITYAVLKGVDLYKNSPKNNPSVPRLSFVDHVIASKSLMSSWIFWLVCLFNVSFLTYLWGMNSWLPTYLSQDRGIDLKAYGFIASLPFIGMLIGEVFGSVVSDKLNRRALMCMISLIGAGLGLIAVVNISNNYAMIGAMAVSMFFWGIGAPNVFALLAKVTDIRVSATAGGIFNGLGNFASALVPSIIGFLIAKYGDLNMGILFLAGMAFIGSIALVPHVYKKI